ncbi:tRNA (adenosine(37)-N6)-threonylcarbamoyltransferase complex ATPase subunit type 1 TsaE, partial [Akkermansiaceae bacterium]|nr:tRNA (adenosine(37)-N6)-threonylcarbamoyltransferase complex ATPase subunit type 1 TsaE [Akkermansiaceae bacterium]
FPVKLPDAAATISLGREIGLIAKAGEVIALVGDLGAGKTTLTQGIFSGSGIFRGAIRGVSFRFLSRRGRARTFRSWMG